MDPEKNNDLDTPLNFAARDCKNVKTRYGSMWISKHDKVIGASMEKTGRFEENSISEVVSFLKTTYGFTPISFIDIGANIGTHLVYALTNLRFKKAIGIEPDPFNFSLLKKNIDCNGVADSSNIFNIAISDTSAFANLALSKTNFGDHRIQNGGEAICDDNDKSERKLINVRVDTFDNFIRKNDIYTDSNTLVWIDTQGHEGHVLTGIKNIEEQKQPFVVLEFWPIELEKGGRKDTLIDFFQNCECVIDLRNKKWWKHPKLLSIAEILKLYAALQSESNPNKLSHTDLLCIPKGLKPYSKKKSKSLFSLFKSTLKKVPLSLSQ